MAGQGRPYYPDFHESKPRMFIHPEINPKESGYDRSQRCKYTDECRPELTEEQEARNAAIPGVFESERNRFLQTAIRPWLLVYAADPSALRAGTLTDAFSKADYELAANAVQGSWPNVFVWKGRVRKQRDGAYVAVLRMDTDVDLGKAWIWLGPRDQMPESLRRARDQFYEDRERAVESIVQLRESVRWLWILCYGLRREPVRIASGAHEPRRVTRHIVHPAQTQQDALNEFAASLVNPPQRFVAHIRSPSGYHQVKLVPPVHGAEVSSQLQQVRLRSQQRYPCLEETREGPAAPGTRSDGQSPPSISRRPGGEQGPPEDDTAENEEDTA